MSAASSPAAMARTVTQSAGINGVHFERSTDAITGEFVQIDVIEAAVFALLTMPGNTGDVLTGFTVAAGLSIKGRITAFTLTSGKVMAYYGSL